jgi:hypothetical protein
MEDIGYAQDMEGMRKKQENEEEIQRNKAQRRSEVRER